LTTITAPNDTTTVATAAAAAIDDKKGLDVVLLDVSGLLVITDVFVIATGTSNRHVGTLIDEVEEQLRERLERRPLRREGLEDRRWVLLDYGDIVVHVFDADTRAYYDLERLWGDAPRLAFEPTAAEA
jgi:ribosome-associated protein